MSQWTHVNASIRYDGIPNLMGDPITESELGKPVTFFDDFDDCILPCGTEGSLEYEIIRTHKYSDGHIACRAVIFTGDLRDYEDDDEILQYFRRITEGKWIRSGLLEIDIEFRKVLVYRYSSVGEEGPGWRLVSEIPYESD